MKFKDGAVFGEASGAGSRVIGLLIYLELFPSYRRPKLVVDTEKDVF